jgi:Ca-activated chloride channel homolog
MKSLRKIMFGTSVALVFAPLVYLAAQSPQAASQPPGASQAARPPANPALSDAQARITVNSNLVILPVTVKDHSGELVPDLRRDEFRIFEDNVEQRIDVFTAEAFPLSMVILIDNDLKDKDAEKVQSSLTAIIGGMSADDEALVCRFDQFFHPGKGFTTDQDKLSKELKRTSLSSEPGLTAPSAPFSSGATINNHSAIDDSAIDKGARAIKGQPTKALDDAVFAAAQLLHDRPRSRRRVILLISDGVNGGKKFNKVSSEDVIKALLHENISVYSIAVPSAYLERKVSPIDRQRSPLIRYADHSGGEVYHATKEHSFEEFYSRLTEEARNQYTLAYVPRGTDPAAEYHSIEVRVKRDGLDIKTREGYYAGQIPAAQVQ